MTRVVVHVGAAQPVVFEHVQLGEETVGSMRERVAAELRRQEAAGQDVGLPADGRLYIRLLSLGRLLSNDEERLAALRMPPRRGSGSDSDAGSADEDEDDVLHLHGAISAGPPRAQAPRRRQGTAAATAAAAVTADVQQVVLGMDAEEGKPTDVLWGLLVGFTLGPLGLFACIERAVTWRMKMGLGVGIFTNMAFCLTSHLFSSS